MRSSTIIFDLDGTLIHTPFDYILKFVNSTLSYFKCTATEEAIRKFWFEHNRNETIETQFGVNHIDFWDKYIQQDDFDERKNYLRIYKDIDVLGYYEPLFFFHIFVYYSTDDNPTLCVETSSAPSGLPPLFSFSSRKC